MTSRKPHRKAAAAEKKREPAPLPASLAAFVTLEEYRAPREKLFTTLASLRWFLAENKAALLAADALRHSLGKVRLHPERTDQVFDEVGKEAAERRFGEEPSR